MTITPQFYIEQSITHITIHIYVPHIRFNVKDIEITLTNHNTILHWYCPPIYLLVLNFTPYQLHSIDNENDDHNDVVEVVEELHKVPNQLDTNTQQDQSLHYKALYLPHVENGMIQLILQKHISFQYDWDDLDLLGKYMQMNHQRNKHISTTSTPHLSSVIAETVTNDTTTTTDISSRYTRNNNTNRTNTTFSTSKLNWLQEVIDDTNHHIDTDTDSNNNNNDNNNTHENDSILLEKNNIPSSPTSSSSSRLHIGNSGNDGTYYGFHRMFTNIFNDLIREQSLLYQMYECPWSSSSSTNTSTTCNSIQQQREVIRIKEYENIKFSIERYMQDFYIDEDDEIYYNMIHMQPHWIQYIITTKQLQQDKDVMVNNDNNDDDDEINSAITNPITREEKQFFTAKERQLLISIPYPLMDDPMILYPPISLINNNNTTTTTTTSTSNNNNNDNNIYQQHSIKQQYALCIGLIDILFAYIYDHISTNNEPNVESAWTITILSTTLSWLHDWYDYETNNNNNTDDSNSLLQKMVLSVIQSSTRRALIYPYIRSFHICIHIWEHILLILQSCGIRTIIKCLLQIRTILNCSELYYLGNKLYIDPYLIWLQQYKDHQYLQTQILIPISNYIINIIQDTHTLKDSLGLNLIQIENDIFNDSDDENNNIAIDVHDNNIHHVPSEEDTSDDDDDDDSDDDDEEEDDDSSESHCDNDSSVNDNRSEIHRHGGISVDDDKEKNLTANDINEVSTATDSLQRLEIDSTIPQRNKTIDDLFNICQDMESLSTSTSQCKSSTTGTPLIQELE